MRNGTGACAAAPVFVRPESVSSRRRRASVTMVTTADADLAERFAAGDPDAIRAVYQRYGRLVYSVAHKVLGDSSLAEDATQQAFVQAWRSAATYDPAR